MKRRDFLAVGIGLAAPWPLARAQVRFPERPVRLIVPFPPGGDGDVMGRLWAKHATSHLGGAIVVENRAGAGGAIGATEVARARADGHVLLLGTTTTQIVNPATQDNPAYDPLKDFALIAMLGVTPTCIVVNPALPASSLRELASLVKANPGKYSYGSAGAGTITNLTGELFKLQAGGLDMIHVPYKGGGPALQDLIAGHIPVITPILSAGVIAQHRAGRARILGVNGDARMKAVADIPTSVEAGIPDMRVQVFSALFAPAGTPRDAIAVLREATLKSAAEPGFLQDLERAAAEPFVHPNAEAFLREEVVRWKRVIQAIGFKAQ